MVAEVMKGDPPSNRVGRPFSVDVTEMRELALANPGKWVADTFTENEANSVRRQFKLMGWEVATVMANQPGYRKVMVRNA